MPALFISRKIRKKEIYTCVRENVIVKYTKRV